MAYYAVVSAYLAEMDGAWRSRLDEVDLEGLWKFSF